MKRASRSYADSPAPDFLTSLSESQWNGIQFKASEALWQKENLPFELELYHPGFIYNRTVAINIADETGSHALRFSPDFFNYNTKGVAEKITGDDLGFAGFRIVHPLNGERSRDIIAAFLGASYFRAVGKQSTPGISARALALNTALPNGEEFPYFREFWFVKPKSGDSAVTVCALLESPTLTGAYRFVITPGTSTVMDVEARLFRRKNAPWPEKVGMAPLTSMFLFGESGTGWPNDYRPEVHNSDGLLLNSGENLWSWAPLANPSRLTINTFQMENPKGFGLFQRDNNFDHYQDIDARFELRSSVWVEPQSEWGSGRVELIKIPSTEEIHDNIVAFWVPDSLTLAEDDAEHKVASIAYKLYWMTPGVTPHGLGRVASTRVIKRNDTVRFIIDFEGETLKALPADTGLTSLIESPDEVSVTEKQLTKNPATGGWRLSFSAKVPKQEGVVQSIISAREGTPQLRFRALLKKGENLPDPLTEEWVYDLPS